MNNNSNSMVNSALDVTSRPRNMSTSDLHMSYTNPSSPNNNFQVNTNFFNYPALNSSLPNSPCIRPHSMIVLESKNENENFKNVNTTRGSTPGANSTLIDELTYHDNDNTITAASSAYNNPNNQSKLVQNLFDPNHHFQSINPPEQTLHAPKSEPLLNSQSIEPATQEASNKQKSKPSLISSLKSSFISKNSNSKLHLSPFSNLKNGNSKTNQKQEKNKKQQQEKQKNNQEKQAQVHNPSPLATSDGLLITYGNLSTSVQTSLITPAGQSNLVDLEYNCFASSTSSTSSSNVSIVDKHAIGETKENKS